MAAIAFSSSIAFLLLGTIYGDVSSWKDKAVSSKDGHGSKCDDCLEAEPMNALPKPLPAQEETDSCGQRESSLHRAAAGGWTATVRQLLQSGTPVDARTSDRDCDVCYRDTGQTPLHYAAARGHLEVMSLLLEHGAEISATTVCGDTPLHKAALNGQAEAVRWLVDRGADLEAKNVFGAVPLKMALVNSREEVVRLLLRKGASRESALIGSMATWDLADVWSSEGYHENPALILVECAAMLFMRRFFS